MTLKQFQILQAIDHLSVLARYETEGLAAEGWVNRPTGVSLEEMTALEKTGLVEMFLVTGHGDNAYYRLTGEWPNARR